MKEAKFRFAALFVCGLLYPCLAHAQNSTSARWLGLNLNAFVDPQKVGYERPGFMNGTIQSYELNTGNLLNLGITFRTMNDKGWFHEFGITALELKKEKELGLFLDPDSGILEPTGGGTKHLFGFWTRYEYGRWFLPEEGKKLSCGLSLSLDPFMISHKIQPATSADFPFKVQQIGADMRVIPRIAYHISSKMMVELKIPLRINTTYFEHERLENPILTEEERTENSLIHEWRFDGWQCAAGISLRL